MCGIEKPEELGNAMLLVSSNPTLQKKLVSNGFATVERYQWSAIISQLALYYNEISQWAPDDKVRR